MSSTVLMVLLWEEIQTTIASSSLAHHLCALKMFLNAQMAPLWAEILTTIVASSLVQLLVQWTFLLALMEVLSSVIQITTASSPHAMMQFVV